MIGWKSQIIAVLVVLVFGSLAMQRTSVAQSGGSTQELVFPVAVDIFGDITIRTLYGIANLGQEFRPRFQFFTNNGRDFLSSSPLPIPPNGMFEEPRFLDFVVIEENGWALVTLPGDARVKAWEELLTFRRVQGGFELVSATKIEAVKAAKKFRTSLGNTPKFRDIFGISAPGGSDLRQTAYAIVNASKTETANIAVSALDSRGNTVCSSSLTLPPLNRIGKFASEIFSPCIPPVVGSMIVGSDVPIAVGGLDVFFPEGKLSSLPVTVLE